MDNELAQSHNSRAAKSGADSADSGPTLGAAAIPADPDLALIVHRWLTLPNDAKAAILVLVRQVVEPKAE